MKHLIAVIWAGCWALGAAAQAPAWWVEPDTLLEVALPLDSTMAVAEIAYSDAAATDSVTWAWKRVAWVAPAGWEADLCDPTVCHTGVPASAVQLPLAPDAPSFLKLLISSRGIPGEAAGTFWVFPEGQIQHRLTLHFHFTSGPVAAPAPPAPTAGLYPNPTTGPLAWRGEVPTAGAWRVVHASGQCVALGTFPQLPDLTSAAPGLYFFQSESPDLPLIRLIKH